MTIIFLSRYQTAVERGVENYVSELSSRLSSEFQVSILTSFWKLIGKKADVIYPLNGGIQALGCRLYAWITGAKLVIGGHAGIGRDDRLNLYLFPDLFIAFSQKGYSWARRVNPFIKIVKISHGVDLAQFNPNVKPKKLDLEEPIFLTASHLEQYKKVVETVRAVAQLQRGSLVVLGEGPLERDIDQSGQNLLGGRRYRRVVVSHKDVPSYLTAADVFTLVSGSQEAFGLVYLEALACNLPVVATDDSLRHELIGDAGLFVKKPENSDEYSSILEQVMKKKWGRRPLEQAEKFDWKRIIAMYNTVFSRL